MRSSSIGRRSGTSRSRRLPAGRHVESGEVRIPPTPVMPPWRSSTAAARMRSTPGCRCAAATLAHCWRRVGKGGRVALRPMTPQTCGIRTDLRRSCVGELLDAGAESAASSSAPASKRPLYGPRGGCAPASRLRLRRASPRRRRSSLSGIRTQVRGRFHQVPASQQSAEHSYRKPIPGPSEAPGVLSCTWDMGGSYSPQPQS